MFDDQLEAAIEFYTTTFPDSEIRNVARTGEDGPVTSAEFVIGGQFFMGYNGGSYFRFSQGFSLFVDCKDQKEVDEYWNKLISAGATSLQCSWITDHFGITWQIVPRRFMELISDKDPKKVQAVMEAIMKMVKLDVAELERAYEDAYRTMSAAAGRIPQRTPSQFSFPTRLSDSKSQSGQLAERARPTLPDLQM